MNKRAWYLAGVVLLSAACQQGFGPTVERYVPTDSSVVAVDSTPARPEPHRKVIP